MKKVFLFLAVSFLTIYTQAQSITVTAPNGGEVLYACQTYTITWNATGTSNFYDIDYSLNNGGTWASVATNINVTNGQYIWTVPNAESNICLIRIRDKNNITIEDISNAVFSIKIPVVVTAPNGGESWLSGSQHLITWNIQGTSLTFNLAYSINGGLNWTSIATNVSTSTGTYNWTVPNTPSTNCLVRVIDAVTTCMQDVSNAAFTILPLTPIMTYPNGGQVFNWNEPINITWLASTYYNTNVRLEYSIDNGASWILITASTTNDGSQSWTVPSNINSTTCLIKVSDATTVILNDASNAVFSIAAPDAIITAPNGGESLLGCNSYTIQFTLTGTDYISPVVALYYSLNNGSNWSIITSATYTLTSGAKTYSWTVPNGNSSTQCLLRARSIAYPTIDDTSNAVFSIQPNNTITVTSPNGGETFTPNTSRTITWTNTPDVSGLYNIFYSTDGGSSYTTIATGVSGNSYVWASVANVPSTNCLIRVQDQANSCKNDVSDAAFTILPLTPIMTYPNGGQVFNWNEPINITWLASTYYNTNVRLEYSIDNGASWILITGSTTNDGSQSWTVPSNINSTTCLIKVSDATTVILNDASNAVFSIAAPDAIITAPNGGESLLGCNSYTIQFTLTGTDYISPVVALYYSLNNGSNWSIITSATYTLTSGAKTYSWTVPNGNSSTQCLVRARSIAYPTIDDTSNAVFSIQPNNTITVTSPNGGETFTPNTSRTITWTNTPDVSGLYNIFYSTDGGSSYTTIATGVSGNSYVWASVANIPSTNCIIRVQDQANSCKNDVSDAAFTILPLTPLMTYPNGGQVFNWNEPINITWLASTYYNTNVRLEYSIDNGASWILITASTTNDGSQSWTVPSNINSTTCLIKVSDATTVILNDASNAVFSIAAPDAIITAPNGGESLLGCNSYTIQFTLTGTDYISPVVALYYSLNNGSNWSIITSATYTLTSGAKTYSWTVPNGNSSTQCLVRARSIAYPTIDDTSNAVFSIQPNNTITVTSPNGGETFTPNTSRTITWTNTPDVSGLYNIFYSTDGGSSYTTIATGVSGNSYVWASVPNIPSTNCLIRVQDQANSCKNDVSDAAFTIRPLSPIMTYPNGGQVFAWSQPINITWSSATYYNSNVRLEYSIDNGASWILITASTTNDGSQSWTIPSNINSTTCLVKVSDASTVSLNDVSNATFSILQPGVTVVAPNGGESLLGCNSTNIQYNLSWNDNISVNAVLQYSINNGTNWSTITSTTVPAATSTVTYPWTVPNGISSTQCLVRVYSTNYPIINDTSNAVFSIQPNNTITVTSPNGGETFTPNTSRTITWTNTPDVSGLYNIFYSTDGGSSYTTIATGVSGNSYVWASVANVPSTNCIIRVQDQANSCKYDVSDAAFTIRPLTPIMTYPNGGQVFNWNEPINITWLASTYYNTNVRLEYSIDNGASWILITASTTNDGSQSWTVPSNINSTTCLVKVSDATTVILNDASNAVFSIAAPDAIITAPNGGESLLGCNSYTIQFTLTGTDYISPVVALYYSLNNGSNWSIITSSTYTLTSGAKTYSWTVPNGNSSTQCLVRARSIAYPTIDDTSNAVFSIQPNNTITVTSPNGGETFTPNTSRTITWTNTPDVSGLYNIFYSTDGGSSYTIIATGVSGNSYVWASVPNIPSTNCIIRVQDQANSCKNDVSDAAFTIRPLSPIMTYPNGGEVFSSVTSINITWLSSTYYNTNVRLEYSLDSGITWNLISASTLNDGSQAWTLPFANSTKCLVKVSDATNVNLNDVSNAVFTITPIVKITNPNGLDELGACTQTSITFTHTANFTSFDIAYSLNNGASWNGIINGYAQGGTTGSYNWSIPNVISAQALIRVSPAGNAAYGDISDTTFKINPAVTLIQPNFGGTVQAGSVFPIKWTSDGISNLYDLAYSTTGSAGPWINIVIGFNTASNTYNWTVPNTFSTNCYIRVRDNVATCKEDISNFSFTISATAPPLTVTAPNGQDVLLGCQNTNITWTETGAPAGSYKIELSVNGGINWSIIESNYASTSGSYNWIVQNTYSALALIRVSAVSNSSLTDASDAAFTITNRNITATLDTILCSPGTIQLNATGGLGSYSWSPAIGLNNANIANPVATVNASIQYVVNSSNGTCTLSDTVMITLAKPIMVTVEVNTPVVCAGNTARFTAHATDAVAAAYQWKKNNVNIGTSDSVLLVNGILSSDVITCTVSSALPCISNATSSAVSVTTAYQSIGADTAITAGCNNCTVNLTTLYNTAAYPVTTWNTATPAAAMLGAYTVIVTGGSCKDTAVVNVNVNEANDIKGCADGNLYIQSDIIGTTYQWQQNSGSGFVNIANSATYTGVTTAVLQLKNAPSSWYGYQYRCLVNGISYSTVKKIKIATIWTGAVSNSWNNAGNWSCGKVPDANTDVFIYSGVTNNLVVAGSVSCRSLTAETGTIVTVTTGGSVIITGQ